MQVSLLGYAEEEVTAEHRQITPRENALVLIDASSGDKLKAWDFALAIWLHNPPGADKEYWLAVTEAVAQAEAYLVGVETPECARYDA